MLSGLEVEDIRAWDSGNMSYAIPAIAVGYKAEAVEKSAVYSMDVDILDSLGYTIQSKPEDRLQASYRESARKMMESKKALAEYRRQSK